MIDITPPGVNKGTALLKAAAILGVRQEEVMAIGDSENDLRMLGYAAVPVVMANADDEIKSIAALVAPSNDEDGVAWVLDRLAEGEL